MRVVIASFSAVYTGRGSTTLCEGVRCILIKSDGAVSIHTNMGNKPLNYMGAGTVFSHKETLSGSQWSFDSRKENLTLNISHILSDCSYTLPDTEVGLVRDGTEPHLQAWLAENITVFGEGFSLISREYNTNAGPVDIYALDEKGEPVAIEVKRTALLGAADQLKRYVDSLNSSPHEYAHKVTRGLLAAVDIRPSAQKMAEKRGFECFTVPFDWNARQGDNMRARQL